MKRALIVAGLIVFAVVGLLEAQTTGITDREIQRFVLPGTNTTGHRVHASRVHMSLTLPSGNIIARGGYKTLIAFAHPEATKASLTNVAMVLAGAGLRSSNAGVSYQRAAFAGSIIGITLGASTALTTGTATAEATILPFNSTTVQPTGLTVTLDAALATSQFNAEERARGLFAFTGADSVGCRITTAATLAPVTGVLACTVIIEF